MKIVVTGGAEFIGSHLVDALVMEENADIWVLDNLYRGKLEFIQQHLKDRSINFVRGDIRDLRTLRRVFAGAKVVFHLAAQSNVLGSVTDLEYSFSTNVNGTINVLRAAERAGVNRVVFSSSREVYGEPECIPVNEGMLLSAKNPYAASKIAGEAYCQAFAATGLEVVILRLSNVYGTRDSDRVIPIFVQAMLHNESVVVYGRNKLVDFVWVGEVIRVLIESGLRLDCVHVPVNVASGVGIKLVDLAERLSDLTQSQSRIRVLPQRKFEVDGFVADTTRLHRFFAKGMGDDPVANLNEVVAYWQEKDRRYDKIASR